MGNNMSIMVSHIKSVLQCLWFSKKSTWLQVVNFKKMVRMKKTPRKMKETSRIKGRSGKGSGETPRQTTQTDKAPRKQLALKGEHSKCSKFLNEFFMQYTKKQLYEICSIFLFLTETTARKSTPDQ